MAAVLRILCDNYTSYWNEVSDHRTDDLFLAGSPWKVIAVTLSYLYFVRNLGPRLMKDRPAFNVEPVIRVYNVLQICANLYLIYCCHGLGYLRTHSWYCEPVDYSTSPHGLKRARASHLYIMLKLVDLLDTIFFVLRKKNNQITFLHVYHHVLMLIGSWIAFKLTLGDGHGVFMGYINCWVHAVMYAYYFVTSMWPEYKKNIWWKKYVTQLQMLQFLFIFLHGLIPFFIECPYPKLMAFVLSSQAFIIFVLFTNFYIKTYHKKKTS